MTTKQYLSYLIKIRLRIEALERSIEKCYAKAEKITPSTSEIPSFNAQNNSSKVETNVLEVVEYKKELEELDVELKAFAFQATIQINKISDNLFAALLMNRYVCGMTWEQVAEVIDKDVDYTKKALHNKALREFEKVNPEPTPKNPFITPLP